MSNPLSMFRKHQFAMMVILVFVAMSAFVVAPSIDEFLRARSNGGATIDPVVVSYNGGQIRDSELQRARQAHNLLILYLRSLVQLTVERDGTPGGVRTNAFGQVVDPGIPSSDSDQDLVYTQLLAEKAASMGLVVSNEALITFLQNLTGEIIPTREFGGILQQVLGDRVTEEFLLDRLRDELLAQKMRTMMQSGLFVAPAGAVTPGKAWEYFQRLNRRVEAEMISIPVASFYDELNKQPSDSELRAKFEEGKNRFPMPDQHEPGFRRRRQAAFQYARVEFQDFVDAEKAKLIDTITDEEIERHYEQNRQKYPLSVDPATDFPAGGASSETNAASKEAGDATSSDAETPSGSDEPAAPAESTDPTVAPPAPDEQSEAPSDSQSRSAPTKLVFISAQAEDSTAADAPAETAADSPSADEASTTDTPTTEPPAADTSSAVTPADETPTTSPPATDGPATDEPATDEPATDGPPAGGTAAETPPESPAEPAIRPLDDKLREEIRDEIAEVKARQLAQERLDKALDDVRNYVEKFDRQRRRSEFQESPTVSMADRINLDELEHDELLTLSEVPLVDALTVASYELSNSAEMQFTSWPPQTIQFEDVAFEEGLPAFAPLRISGEVSGVTFVFWKTDEVDPYVPSLEEAREEVIEAWKREDALELAKLQAEQLVDESRGKESLAALVEGREDLTIIRPQPFSWMSTGFNPSGMGAPALSFVEGVEGIGPDLMRSIFALDVDETGVAINQPRTIVYVVRIDGQMPSLDLLRQQFLQSGVTFEVASIADADNIALRQAWYDDLDKELGVVWQEDTSS